MRKIKSIILSAALLLTGLASYSQVSETVNLTAAGTLKTYSFTNPAATITNLTVTGRIDARDVQFMRDNMEVLEVLDLSSVTIDAYTGEEGTIGGIYTYPANEIPMSSFHNTLLYPNQTSLVSVVLPSSLTSIGNGAFSECSELINVSFPSGLISIGDLAFSRCSGLTNLNFPSDLTSIGRSAFLECSGLTSMNFPSSLTSIGFWAFYGCSRLTSVSFPSSLTSIEEWTFAGCSGLTSLSFPTGLISIGAFAFYECSGLTEITNLNPVPIAIEESVFDGVNKSTCGLKVLAAAVSLYKAAAVWQDFMVSTTSTANQKGIAVYPNPVKDVININLQDKTTQASFKLYDMHGQQLLQQDIHKENTVSVAHLSSGIYIYTITINGKKIMEKETIVKE
jgi:hypothetical protein